VACCVFRLDLPGLAFWLFPYSRSRLFAISKLDDFRSQLICSHGPPSLAVDDQRSSLGIDFPINKSSHE